MGLWRLKGPGVRGGFGRRGVLESPERGLEDVEDPPGGGVRNDTHACKVLSWWSITAITLFYCLAS